MNLRPSRKWITYPLLFMVSLGLIGIAILAIAVMIVYPRLPDVKVLQDYRPAIPLRVYTADGVQIGEFGQERRDFLKIADVPEKMKQALMAAEDERFYQHGGVDYISVARALLSNFTKGKTVSGASTITQQVAKNFFLTPEQTMERKFKEALLAFKIEQNFSKDQILELYMNQINLGQRAYGFGAAAKIYYGKPINELSIAQYAMLAGLPKAPSKFNPVVNPERAKTRQLYVLRRMHELGFITDAEWSAAQVEELHVLKSQADFTVRGEYVAEMVRQFMVDQYKDAAYTQGYKVYTTILADHQETAHLAVRHGMLDFDKRHGYRGAESYIDISNYAEGPVEQREDYLDQMLQEVKDSGDIYPAVVLEASPKKVVAYRKGGETLELTGAGLQFAQRMIGPKANEAVRIRPGAVIRVFQNSKGQWEISQLPQIESAFVSMDPNTGAMKALVGGFDFNRNNFNHATQAWRQPGSSFKPIIYSAALEKGFTASTIINDAPLVIDQGGQRWEPKNSDGRFSGPMSLRQALTKSKNLVSIRILQAITPQYAQEYMQKFGFTPDKHPPYLTMALGAGSVTPYQMSAAYSVFANGGYKVQPYFIERIEDPKGKVVFQSKPYVVGQNAPEAIDPRNAFIMTSVMGDVVRYGTAARAMSLGRKDLAGKTGTTNDVMDAWFAGFSQRNLVGVVWVGYDQPKPLGGSETGGHAALPIWMTYMGKVLKGIPERPLPMPKGVVKQGSEYYYAERTSTAPGLGLDNSSSARPASGEGGDGGEEAGTNVETVRDLLF
ncbi:penicillin-binding protein 1A [Leeia aquatica]|uniref:Penicillin-binding protein 1A n=1 Tax=Leeia aquatica TaxID=2725557 RepID=A0A847SGK6_9NEIS|nr:penicillin-binding protein 1A [Leeia aquatica]NLR75072.1 penicillin-binding protein 1A [Leeia aquatica]